MIEGRHLHFVGIGGSGMAPLARLLTMMGHEVSGSDCKESVRLAELRALGVTVTVGHDKGNVVGADRVIVSLAVDESNPEVTEARRLGIPVVTRAEALADIFNSRKGIGVAGTHGKTTTTSMIAYVLEKSGLDPTIAVGGEMMDFGFGGKPGRGDLFVAEADEAYKSFLHLRPFIAVVTNIDDDHRDHYGSFDAIIEGFRSYVSAVKQGGLVVYCGDDPNVLHAMKNHPGEMVSYGTAPACEYVVQSYEAGPTTTRFTLVHGDSRLAVTLKVPGMHNALNASATLIVCERLGVDTTRAAQILSSFSGARRRSELIGRVGSVSVYDDYAHHPSEIAATLRAFREKHPNRLIVVFQPHRFSRTQMLMEQFSRAFCDANVVILDDIFYKGTGETPVSGVNSEVLAGKIAEASGKRVIYMPGKGEIARYLSTHVEEGDVVLTMGAGDIRECAESLVELLRGAADGCQDIR